MNNIAGIYRRRVVMQTKQQESSVQRRNEILTCAQWIAKYGWPAMGGLRWLIFRAKNDPELRKIFHSSPKASSTEGTRGSSISRGDE